jgi:hypothetical protein
MQATEKGVEFGLNARAHARDHHGRQARQGELAIAGEGPRPKTYLLGQRGVEQKVSELGQQRLVVEYSSSYCLFINDLTNAILPVSHRVHKGYKLKLRALRTAAEVMTTEVHSVTPAMHPSVAARLMVDHHLTSLPVVDDGKVIGVVSRIDLLSLLKELENPLKREN